MLIVNRCLPQGQGLAPSLIRRSPCLTLDWDTRQKSRFEGVDSEGRRVAVYLPRGTVVRGGDVLLTQCNQWVKVQAAPQGVLRITVDPNHGNTFDLMRAAYHLGNRHVPIELSPEGLQIEPDHVLAELLRSWRLVVEQTCAPFEPEGGAYGDNAMLGHSHGHGHLHEHSHGHGHP
jgi:urease accessory protein